MGGLAKGLEVLRSFSSSRPHMTLSEIAAQAGLPAATARRCLNTLEELGYVGRRGRQFLLRPAVLEIGAAYLDSMEIRAVTRTRLEALALASQGSAAMGVLSGNGVVIVARASARTEPLRVEAQVGSRLPVHATSIGKVLLAGLPPAQQQAIADDALQHFTERTITDRAKLLQQIDAAAVNGYAMATSEVAEDVASIAVPVRDASGRVVAAINTSVHCDQATPAQMVEKFLPGLRAAAAAISAEVARVPALTLGAQL